MEMNKGEAERCVLIAVKAERSGDLEKAARFLSKAERLYPSLSGLKERQSKLKAKTTGAKAESSAGPTADGVGAGGKREGEGGGVRRRHPSVRSSDSNAASRESETRSYTAEQLKIARRINSCKNHYEVLSIAKDATEADIKKAYRKLALKVHPDKNTAPGAEDGFKAVGRAFSVLSDADKRAHYDRFGEDDPAQAPAHRGGFSRGRAHGGVYADEMTPEEIFNMFFGGGMGGSFRMHRSRRAGPHYARGGGAHHHGDEEGQAHPLGGLIQLLPLLLLLLLSLSSFTGREELPFSLRPTSEFNIQRHTTSGNVVRGIPYYVKHTFESAFARDWRSLRRVEMMVEQGYERRLFGECQNERQRQKRMIYAARSRKNKEDREREMEAALNMEMSSCDELQKFRGG